MNTEEVNSEVTEIEGSVTPEISNEIQENIVEAKKEDSFLFEEVDVDFLDGHNEDIKEMFSLIKDKKFGDLKNKIEDYIPKDYDTWNKEALLYQKVKTENPYFTEEDIRDTLLMKYGIGEDYDALLNDEFVDDKEKAKINRQKREKELLIKSDLEDIKSKLKSKYKDIDTSSLEFKKKVSLKKEKELTQEEQMAQFSEAASKWKENVSQKLSDFKGVDLSFELDTDNNEEKEKFELSFDGDEDSLRVINESISDNMANDAVNRLLFSFDEKGELVKDEHGRPYLDVNKVQKLLFIEKNMSEIVKKAVIQARRNTEIDIKKKQKNIDFNNAISSNNQNIEPSASDKKRQMAQRLL